MASKYTLSPKKKLQSGTGRTGMDIAADIGRAAAQGMTFGLSDEIYGAYKAFTSDKSYEDAANEIREGLARFKETDPVKAYGFEILGSLLTGGAGAAAAKLGVKAAGTIGGGIYGAATGETPEERIVGGAIGAPLGLATAAAGQAISPKVTQAAQALMKKGYPLTPGQALGGVTKSIEEKISLPFAQEMIQGQQKNVMKAFNRDMVETAVAPIGAKLPKNLEGEDLVEAASEAVSDAYGKVVPKLSIDASVLPNKAAEIAARRQLNAADAKEFNEIIKDLVQRNVSGGNLSKETLKDVETDLTSEVFSTANKGGREGRIGRAVKEFRDALRAEISAQNPNVPDLQNINKAFSAMRPIEKAKESALSKAGIFGPTQLLRQMKKKAPTDPIKAAARQAREVIGPTVPSSGSAERIAVSEMFRNPFGMAAGVPTSLLLSGLYRTPPGRKLARGMIQAPGAALRRGAPAAGGLLSQQAPSFISSAQASSIEDMAAGGNIVGYETVTDRQGNPVTFAKTSDGRAVRVR